MGTGQGTEETRGDSQDPGCCHPHPMHTLVSAGLTADQGTPVYFLETEVTLPSQGSNHGHSRVRAEGLSHLEMISVVNKKCSRTNESDMS